MPDPVFLMGLEVGSPDLISHGMAFITSHIPTFLTVGFSIFHVEEAVPKRLLAGCTDKAGGMPRLSQCMHHFLGERAELRTERSLGERERHWTSSTQVAIREQDRRA